MKTRAIVQTGPGQLELRELPVPEIDDDSAILRVEACGLCGTDVEQFAGLIPARFPLVPGHEPVGVIDRIGARAAQRWGVTVGDRVAVENYLPCAHCPPCLEGHYPRCERRQGNFGYGHIGLSHPPGIWGAFADYMYLDPASILHPISQAVSPAIATLFNPLGAGYRWAVELGGIKPGDTVVVLGAGQRGLAAAIAAHAAGAEHVIVTGLTADAHKLTLAQQLGADVIDVQAEDTFTRVYELTDGRCADIVVEVASSATDPVVDAIHCAKSGGTVVLAGIKGFKAIPGFVSDLIVIKEITVKGAFAVTNRAYRWAVRMLETSSDLPLVALHTHDFPLEDAEAAIRTLAGEVPDEEPIHCSVLPTL